MNKVKIPKPKKYQQNREAKQHLHPRSLARSVVHNRMAQQDMYGVNKVHSGESQSTFGKLWREEAVAIAAESK